jgi:hypothetical protein
MLQSLPKQLLLAGRQSAECRISLQLAFLFGRRQIFIASQPVSSVASRPRPHLGLPKRLLRRKRASLLRLKRGGVQYAGDGNGQSHHQTGARQPIRSVLSRPHFPRLYCSSPSFNSCCDKPH